MAKTSATGKTASRKKPAAKPAAAKPASKSSRSARRDPPAPPPWFPGTLTVVDDEIGVQTSNGFVTLQAIAESGQVVGFVFQPSGGPKSVSVEELLEKLAAFIAEYGVGSIAGQVTTCFVPY